MGNSVKKEKKTKLRAFGKYSWHWWVFVVFGCAFSICGIISYVKWINSNSVSTAEVDMRQFVDQMKTTIGSTWDADAGNLVEISSVLANTENKDSVMKNIAKNDIVYRYLFIEEVQTVGEATDGTILEKDNSHQFTYTDDSQTVQRSEAFLSKSGSWSYLYRCMVTDDDGVYGWIYAQYLFDRIHNLFPDQLYEGDGNCFILDVKTNTIVFQQDEDTYATVVGRKLDDFVTNVLGGSSDSVNRLSNAIQNSDYSMVHENMNNHPTLIYMTPMESNDYYLICIASEDAVVRDINTVRSTSLTILIVVILIVVVTILTTILGIIRRRNRYAMELARAAHEEELQEAFDKATEANKAKSQFLANMSHEIRTPINAVIGMNEMILRTNQQPEVDGYAKDVDEAAHSLLHIVNDILDITKIESGMMDIIPSDYDLEKLIQGIYKVCLVRANKKGILLQVQLDENLPRMLHGDEIRIRQIIMNLMTNAVKYTHEGSVTLSVKGECKGKQLIMDVEVSDTGIGIKKEDIPKLFEKLYRIEESRNRHIEGIGLGINITDELLHMMGSKLEVDSIYGVGSRFSFELTQDIVDVTPISATKNANASEKSKQQALFTAPDAKVLVVDDNPINLKVVSSLLRRTAIRVEQASGGAVCLEMAANNQYDIIFLDHMMPEMDGIETLIRLKAMNGINQNTPVIALTANAIVGAKEQYLEAGFTDYLEKPVDFNALERMIMHYLPETKYTMNATN